MAKNTRNNERRGFIRHRSQYFDDFAKAWLKRDTLTGLIIARKKNGPWKGIRLEKGLAFAQKLPSPMESYDDRPHSAA